jgi:hypothetical protein
VSVLSGALIAAGVALTVMHLPSWALVSIGLLAVVTYCIRRW